MEAWRQDPTKQLIAKFHGRLTSVSVMDVRISPYLTNTVTGVGWEGSRIKARDSTLWHCDRYTPSKTKRGLWMKGLLLLFLGNALDPTAPDHRAGQAFGFAWLPSLGGVPFYLWQLFFWQMRIITRRKRILMGFLAHFKYLNLFLNHINKSRFVLKVMHLSPNCFK